MKGKFINPFTDVGFKRIFGSLVVPIDIIMQASGLTKEQVEAL